MIKLIWAMTKDNLIGKDNELPWHYKEDLQYFKENTLNKDVLMGYNTYLSIYNRLGKALPKRNNYVLCSDICKLAPGVKQVKDLKEFINQYKDNDSTLFVIGGASVYAQTIMDADYLYITLINKEYQGNVYFQEIDYSKFTLIKETNVNELSFRIYKRNK